MKKSFLTEHRIVISRIMVILAIICALILTPYRNKIPVLSESLEFIGMSLTIIGVLGRIFSGVFMGNNRDRRIVKHGIYSTTRNPLYFFSFVSAFGVLTIYGSIIFIIIYVFVFYLFYNRVIKGEEEYLIKHFGEEYIEYKRKTPRFIPNFKLWSVENEYVEVSYKSLLKTILDSSVILLCALILIYYIRFNPFLGWVYIY
ncbi:methyltransferase family protein [Rickettsiales bacterium LUAb2]